jgi:hypothetical protein
MKRRDILGTTFDRLISDVTRERAPRRPVARRPRNPGIEKYQQHDGLKLLASMGADFYVLGTRRSRGKPCPKCKTFVPEDQGTRQTEGISDVLIFLPLQPGASHRVTLWWEAKHADGGRLSPAQVRFADLCRQAAQEHCAGPLAALYAWLVEHGYLDRNRVPHYRLPMGVKP